MSSVITPRNRMRRFQGWLRLFGNHCPRCNSDAPAVDTCCVCKQVANGLGSTEENKRQQYPPTPETKALWWYCWHHAGMERLQKEWERQKGGSDGQRNV